VVVEYRVEAYHIITALLSSFNLGVLTLCIIGINDDDLAVLVGLVGSNLVLVLADEREAIPEAFDQREGIGLFLEFFVGNDAVLDEYTEVAPLLFEGWPVVFEQVTELRARLVQRDIGGINNTVQEQEPFRYNIADIIGNEHLIAVQVNFVA
jgi:hypothetical protein